MRAITKISGKVEGGHGYYFGGVPRILKKGKFLETFRNERNRRE